MPGRCKRRVIKQAVDGMAVQNVAAGLIFAAVETVAAPVQAAGEGAEFGTAKAVGDVLPGIVGTAIRGDAVQPLAAAENGVAVQKCAEKIDFRFGMAVLPQHGAVGFDLAGKSHDEAV